MGATVSVLGWFGPRDLGSIVFAVIVIQETHVPPRRSADMLELTAASGRSHDMSTDTLLNVSAEGDAPESGAGSGDRGGAARERDAALSGRLRQFVVAVRDGDEAMVEELVVRLSASTRTTHARPSSRPGAGTAHATSLSNARVCRRWPGACEGDRRYAGRRD